SGVGWRRCASSKVGASETAAAAASARSARVTSPRTGRGREDSRMPRRCHRAAAAVEAAGDHSLVALGRLLRLLDFLLRLLQLGLELAHVALELADLVLGDEPEALGHLLHGLVEGLLRLPAHLEGL